MTSNIDHRYRVWNTRIGQWNQNDPLGTPNGMNRRAGYHALHGGLDPFGLEFIFQQHAVRRNPETRKLEQRFTVVHQVTRRTLFNFTSWVSPMVDSNTVSEFVLYACPDVFWRHRAGMVNAHQVWANHLNQMEQDQGSAAALQSIVHLVPYGEAADLALLQGDLSGAAKSIVIDSAMNLAGGPLAGKALDAMGSAAKGLIGAAMKAKADDATKAVTRVSVDEGLRLTDEFLNLGTPIRSVDGPTGVQFIQSATNEAGETVTRRAGFDLNPDAPHVDKLGPHLNLQTQIDGVIQKNGPLADPHIPIDPNTIRHPTDYRSP